MLRLSFCIAYVCLLLLPIQAANSSERLTFTRGNAVWLANADGSSAHKLVNGADPMVSPDGTRVAYTLNGEGSVRHIAFVEIPSGKRSVVTDLPSNNAYGPVWSPDGKQIVFNIFVNSHWRLALIQSDGSGFKLIDQSSPLNQDFNSPAWAPDGKSLYCQDLTNIYLIDLSGNVLAKWKIGDVLPDCELDSGSQMRPASDGRSILMDANLSADGPIKQWEGPPPAIFLLDLATGKSKRLTRDKLYAWYPAWLNSSEYLFTGTTDGRNFSVYKASTNGGASAILIKNAQRATIGGS